jgi:hypothetical protein
MEQYALAFGVILIIVMLMAQVVLGGPLSAIDKRGLVSDVAAVMVLTSIITACAVLVFVLLYLYGPRPQVYASAGSVSKPQASAGTQRTQGDVAVRSRHPSVTPARNPASNGSSCQTARNDVCGTSEVPVPMRDHSDGETPTEVEDQTCASTIIP